MRIAHISDCHISIAHPQRLDDLQKCVAAVNRERPDVVIHTGDVAHDALPQEYQQARDALEQLKVPYFVIPGNRDKRGELISVFGHRLQTHEGFVQYAINDYPVALVLLDTVSDQSNKGRFCADRLACARDLLMQTDDKPSLVFMHHTPYDVVEIPDPFQFEQREEVDALIQVFTQTASLKAVYCGHVHRNVKAEDTPLPVSAISCMACDLRKGQLSEYDRTRPMYNIIEM